MELTIYRWMAMEGASEEREIERKNEKRIVDYNISVAYDGNNEVNLMEIHDNIQYSRMRILFIYGSLYIIYVNTPCQLSIIYYISM